MNRGIKSAGLINVGKKIWTNVGRRDKGRQGPTRSATGPSAPYKHQGGRGAWPRDPPTPGPIGPIPNPVGPADFSPPPISRILPTFLLSFFRSTHLQNDSSEIKPVKVLNFN